MPLLRIFHILVLSTLFVLTISGQQTNPVDRRVANPITDTPVAFRGMTWLRFSKGRIVEGWDAWNQGTLMTDLQAVAREQSTRSA